MGASCPIGCPPGIDPRNFPASRLPVHRQVAANRDVAFGALLAWRMSRKAGRWDFFDGGELSNWVSPWHRPQKLPGFPPSCSSPSGREPRRRVWGVVGLADEQEGGKAGRWDFFDG